MKLNNLDLNKLHVFSVAGQASSFSVAAAKLGLSRSAVSQAISGFEQALGVQLFDRVGRGVVLTNAGQQLLERSLQYQASLEQTLTELSQRAEFPKGTARLGVFIGSSRSRLTGCIADFLSEFAEVSVKVVFLPQAELAHRLVERKLDVALSIYPLSRHARLVESHALFQEQLLLVCTLRHHLARPTLNQVRKLPFVDYYESGELTRTWIRHHFRADPGKLRIRAHAAGVDWVLDLIERDVGAGIVPRYVAAPLLSSGRLRQIRTKRAELADTIWLNQLRGFQQEPGAARFLEALRVAFAPRAE